ncbi:MAG: bacterial Ig-like domain-containing protein [Clostridia bacterium]|nr:bacterial Ig-like domain-containing protein [Clostridia bacterium]
MKKTVAWLLCLVTLVACIPYRAAAASDTEVLESILSYIDEHTVVTENGDGTITATLVTGTDESVPPLHSAYTPAFTAPAATTVAKSVQVQAADVNYPDYTYTTNQTHTALPMEQRYLYSLLDKEWQGYYRQIDTAVRQLESSVTLNTNLRQDDRYRIYFLYMFDTPELFYLAAQVVAEFNVNTGKLLFTYAVGNKAGEYCGHNYGSLTYTLRQKILDKKQTFDLVVQNFIATIPSDAPEVVKERLIYDKLQRNGYYNLNAVYNDLWDGLANDNWTAYGMLVNGYGVCESYAEAFQTLCNAVGIVCSSVAGDAGGPHKWNIVQIDGEWYQCDPTFDDPSGSTSTQAGHEYFNLTNARMNELDHTWPETDWPYWDGNYWPVPDCTATKNSWENMVARYGDAPYQTHYFSGGCDDTCNNCNFVRTNVDKDNHAFTDPSDTVCDSCGVERTVVFHFITVTTKPNKLIYAEGEAFSADGMVVTAYFDTGAVEVTDYTVSGYSPTLGEKTITVTYNGKSDSFTVTVRTMRNGWFYENNHWYFYKNNVEVKNVWMRDSYGWCYLGADGAMKTNAWVRDSVGWCYVGANGYCVTNAWMRDNTGWCYLNAEGRMATNRWVRDSVGWCYVGADGYCVTDRWVRDSYGWCYLNTAGRMATNCWVRDSVGWCYVGADGYAVTNCWKRDSYGWCYLNSNGSMTKSQWLQDGGKWYYLDANGYMVTGYHVINGSPYFFGADGALIP